MYFSKFKKLVAVSAIALTSACASTQAYNSDSAVDPYENVNRKIFYFNEGFYENVMFPIARGYRKITTPTIRERVRSFISNVQEPINAINHLLQLEFQKSAESVGRFAINTTMGLGGLFDVAPAWKLEQEKTNFNATLASWCVPQGPYLVVPFLGASSPRSLTGTAVDAVTDPIFLATYNDANISAKVTYPYAAIKYTSVAESYMEIYDDLKHNSVDFYSTMRSAYLQNQKKYRCRFAEPETTESYDFDFEDMDE